MHNMNSMEDSHDSHSSAAATPVEGEASASASSSGAALVPSAGSGSTAAAAAAAATERPHPAQSSTSASSHSNDPQRRKHKMDAAGDSSDEPAAKRAHPMRSAFAQQPTAAANPTRIIRPTILAYVSAAQRLYDDALACVFNFLPLSKQLHAVRVCKGWRMGARKTACQGKSLRPSSLSSLLVSPLSHHISNLDLLSAMLTSNPPAALFARLFRALPHLTHLEHQECDPPPHYPSSLRSLNLRLLPTFPSSVHTSALQSVVQTAPQLHSLELESVWVYGEEDSDPLLDEKQLRLILSLPSLRFLCFNEGAWSDWEFEQICQAQGSSDSVARIEEIDLSDTIVEEDTMKLLAKFPHLTALRPHTFDADAIRLLSTIKQLKQLRLHVKRFEDLTPEELRVALAACPLLTDLTVIGCPASVLHEYIAPALPQLRQLRLVGVALQSCVFLVHLPSLESFECDSCTLLPTISGTEFIRSVREFGNDIRELRFINCSTTIAEAVREEALLIAYYADIANECKPQLS